MEDLLIARVLLLSNEGQNVYFVFTQKFKDNFDECGYAHELTRQYIMMTHMYHACFKWLYYTNVIICVRPGIKINQIFMHWSHCLSTGYLMLRIS